MNYLDIIIFLFLISAIFRGREVGFVRQFISTIGFFSGLFLGVLLEPFTVKLAHGELSRSLIAIVTALGMALLFMSLGEYLGLKAKHRLQFPRLSRANSADNTLGAVLAGISMLLVVWLSASIFAALPSLGVRSTVKHSGIVRLLNAHLPSAPSLVADLGHLIDPNGFPDVFSGNEPSPSTPVDQPSLAGFETAVNLTKASVVKIEGEGCGGIVEGSGFVVASNMVATNAHVVAGISEPTVTDGYGTHKATPVWFDPDLDFAVLRVSGLVGKPLTLNTTVQPRGTAAAVLGYPGGGPFTVKSAAVLDQFTATGRNIYGSGATVRAIYEVQSDIIPGNSGGPMITTDGKVIGVVFAQSSSYKNVGYTLTMDRVSGEIAQAKARNTAVSTSSCSE